jgi:hypothetical protein
MANVLGKQCIPHISSTGLGYLYMMHFVSAIPNSGPYHEFKEFNNELPYTCATEVVPVVRTVFAFFLSGSSCSSVQAAIASGRRLKYT